MAKAIPLQLATALIVASYLSNHKLSARKVDRLILSVHAALAEIGKK
jgi:predicted transcriptional regulator